MSNVITELGLYKPAIWGHSLGAATIVDYATSHSDNLSLIILEDVPWFNDPQKLEAQVKKPYNFIDLQNGTLEEAIELSKRIHPRHMESIHERWAVSKMKFDVNFQRSFSLGKYRWEQMASEITCPTLLLTAEVEKGGIVTPEVAVQALSILPNAQWAYIPKAGHTIRYEQFNLVMGVVMNFLRHFYPA